MTTTTPTWRNYLQLELLLLPLPGKTSYYQELLLELVLELLLELLLVGLMDGLLEGLLEGQLEGL